MKSFRLSRESVPEFVESWPVLLASVAITASLAYFGWLEPVWQISLVLFGGAYFGYVLRGHFRRSLAARYPNARFISLLSIGLFVTTSGVLCRMAFPAIEGSYLDIVWLVVSFTCILIFVLLNRRDPDVMK